MTPFGTGNADGVAADSSGNIWFTEESPGRIGRRAPDGTITQFATPSAADDPAEIAVGPDGDLWFTEPDVDLIGRIVLAAPSFTSDSSGTLVAGQTGSITVAASGFPEPTISDGGAELTPGLTFVDNGDGTATISGTPSTGAAGTYRLTLTASNGEGSDATQSFALTVAPPVSPPSGPSGPTGCPTVPPELLPPPVPAVPYLPPATTSTTSPTSAASTTTPTGVTPTPACASAQARATGTAIGSLVLGMTRGQAGTPFVRSSAHGQDVVDFFCRGAIGIRAVFPSQRLLRSLDAAQRSALSDRIVMIATAASGYEVDGVHPGARLGTLTAKVRHAATLQVGPDGWHLIRGGSSTTAIEVRGGGVQQVGIADRRLTATRADQRLLVSTLSY